ncbi:MAG TPA: substrate-binding domain-containing protein [Actinomycetota bacterium]|nr:substrate-binding domain-containing protein [Actinomycetota bacterium]
MKRALLACVLMLTMVGAITPAVADGHDNYDNVDRLFENSKFCDKFQSFRPREAVVDGPSSQLGLFNEVFEPAYAKACRIGSGLLTYLGTGERAGVNAILNRRADRAFGTTDVPLSQVEIVEANLDLRAPDRRGRITSIHHIPVAVQITAVVFNLSACGVDQLNLRSPVLSSVFSGTITRWNDGVLVRDNPKLADCDAPIRLVKRADVAGSSLSLKDYLSKRNPQWNYYRQPSRNQAWPTIQNYCPALDEGGMADCIRSTQYSIGYIQYRAARLARLKVARLDNPVSTASLDPDTAFVAPSPAACTAAAESAFIPPGHQKRAVTATFFTFETPSVSPTRGDWNSVSLTDAPRGYPLCSLSYALIYISLQNTYHGQLYLPGTARTAVDYLWTAVSPAAQKRLPAFDFGTLPDQIVAVSRLGLSEIRYAG